jgi:ADP-heptose:LPS heptosyltransferase
MGAQKVEDNNITEPARKTLAIIQVTRIGDILQTAHAARLLKINHPEHKVILIARKQFVEPIDFIVKQVFDEVIVLDFKRAISLGNGFEGSIQAIKDQIDHINKHPIDASINLSFSKTSNYIHSLIKSKHKLGAFFNLKNERVIQDKWSQYLFSTVMRGDLNPFNLVDLFAGIIGINKEKTHLSAESYSKEKKNNILLHPFASLDKKMWNESKWTEVIYKLLKNNSELNIYIAGGRQDQASFEKIKMNPLISPMRTRIHSMIAKPLSDLYSLVDETFLFIGHDSMVGNLLSLKGVKSLTVSLGTVRPQETAPYALNNYVLSPKTNCYPCFPDTPCSFYQCHADVPYQVVIETAQQLIKSNILDTEKLRKSINELHLNSIDLRRTTTNGAGQLILTNVLDSEKSLKDCYRDFYHIIWNYAFGEVDLTLDTPKFSKRTKSLLEGTLEPIENLYELAEFGKKYSRYILEEISNKSPDLTKLKNYSAKIDEVDRLLEVVAQSTKVLAPVIDYATVAKSNLYGNNIVELTESAFYVYQEVSTTASILYDFLNGLNITRSKNNQKPGTSV